MALATSGALTLDQIHIEAGGTTGTTCSLNDSDIRGLTAASGRTINSTLGTNIDFADFYGASAASSVPASFGKTGVTPATQSVLITEFFVYMNQSKTSTAIGFTTTGTNALFSETSEFTDSSGNTQEILYISHNGNKSPSPAAFRIRLLGHNVSTSSWTLSYDGVSITGNSGFTHNGATYGTPSVTNSSATGSNNVSYNFTQFLYQITSVTTGSAQQTRFPTTTTSNQSWSIT